MPSGARPKYPWDDWFARDRLTLRRGRDYSCRSSAMESAIRNAAGPDRYNVEVHIIVADDEQSLSVTVKRREE